MKDKVSVIIPTMNRPSALKRTIKAYLKGTLIPTEIIIIDQSNEEKFVEEIKIFLETIAKVKIVYYYQAIASLTVARNKGFSLAENEIIICSDDDVDVYENTLENVVDIMRDKSVSMIGGLDDNMGLSRSGLGYLIGTKSFIKRKIGHVTLSMLGRYPNRVIDEVKTEWAMGYFFVIRKSLVEKWHISWDENLTSYAYAEDLDFSFNYYRKSNEEKLRCILSDKVHVKHLGSLEYRVPSRRSTFMYVINRYYLSVKHKMGLKSRIAMSWCNFWIYIFRVVKKNNPQDFKDAVKYKNKHKRELKLGSIPYEL